MPFPGTATCFIAGGGNEVVASPSPASPAGSGSGSSSAPPAPAMPPGAVPSFTVHSLWELLERLQAADTPLGWRTAIGGYSSSSSSSSEDEGSSSDGEWGGWQAGQAAAPAGDRPGAPPPGIGFLDFLFVSGAVKGARCSFPRVQVGVWASAAALDAVSHPICSLPCPTHILPCPGLTLPVEIARLMLHVARDMHTPRIAFMTASDSRAQEPYDGQQFGLPPDEHPGDRVLHFGCGDAGLTKLLASSGLDVSCRGQVHAVSCWRGAAIQTASAAHMIVGLILPCLSVSC